MATRLYVHLFSAALADCCEVPGCQRPAELFRASAASGRPGWLFRACGPAHARVAEEAALAAERGPLELPADLAGRATGGEPRRRLARSSAPPAT